METIVPKGSIQGSVLFTVYISDISRHEDHQMIAARLAQTHLIKTEELLGTWTLKINPKRRQRLQYIKQTEISACPWTTASVVWIRCRHIFDRSTGGCNVANDVWNTENVTFKDAYVNVMRGKLSKCLEIRN
ncbi:hypothetical protein Trydic_g1518 [Trypoxylus dichotomus]